MFSYKEGYRVTAMSKVPLPLYCVYMRQYVGGSIVSRMLWTETHNSDQTVVLPKAIVRADGRLLGLFVPDSAGNPRVILIDLQTDAVRCIPGARLSNSIDINAMAFIEQYQQFSRIVLHSGHIDLVPLLLPQGYRPLAALDDQFNWFLVVSLSSPIHELFIARVGIDRVYQLDTFPEIRYLRLYRGPTAGDYLLYLHLHERGIRRLDCQRLVHLRLCFPPGTFA
ncbi:MAG: hypothetical protein ACYCOU_00760 [Sulfobacillus sp.]